MATLKYFDTLSQTWKYATVSQQAYVDAQAALKVSKAGDSMSGTLYTPKLDASAATGGIVKVTIPGVNAALFKETASGPEIRNFDDSALEKLSVASPTTANHAATKGYVDKRIQAGNAWSTIAPATVTFPVAFSGLPTAIIITAIAGSVTAAICTVRSSSASGFTFSVVNQADNYVEVQVFWMAIGTVA